MICSVLVSEGMTGPEALERVRTRRWQSAPNDRQIEGLLAFESFWQARQAGHRIDSVTSVSDHAVG